MKRDRECCLGCRHFRNDTPFLEREIAGLTSFGSAHASVRADDGLCNLLDRLTEASSVCRRFEGIASHFSERKDQ